MRNKLETESFNYCDSIKSEDVQSMLLKTFDRVELCYTSPTSPYKCFKGGQLFIANFEGVLISEDTFESFEIYGDNFFVGRHNTGLTDYNNKLIYSYVVYNHYLNIYHISNRQPKYIGWRIIACYEENHKIRLFNPYGELRFDYEITEIEKFGGDKNKFLCHFENPLLTIFQITEHSNYRGLYGLLNNYGEIALKPEFVKIESDQYGNIIAYKESNTYNREWKAFTFDRFLKTTPDFLYNYEDFHVLSADLFVVMNNEGKTGVVNSHNILILPFEYDYIYNLENGLALFSKGKENGVVRLCDKRIIAQSADYGFALCHNIILCVSKDYNYSLFFNIGNSEKEWYDSIEYLFNDYYKVKKYDKYGVINSIGEIIIEVKYDRILLSDEFIILIEAYSCSYESITGGTIYHNDIIDSKDQLFSVRGDDIYILSRNFIPLTNFDFSVTNIVRTSISSYIIKSFRGYGVLDSRFNILIPPILKELRYDDGKYISDLGKHTIDGRFIYEEDQYFSILDSKYTYCKRINEEYFLCLIRSNDLEASKCFRYGILDLRFIEKIPAIYYNIESTYINNLFIVEKIDDDSILNKKYGVINSNNVIVIPFDFDSIKSELNSKCFIVSQRINQQHYFGLYSLEGNLMLKCNYKFIGKESSNFRVISKDNNWGIVNVSNGVVINFPNVSYLGDVQDKYLCINTGGYIAWNENIPQVTNGKWGYMDIMGNQIIPCVYDSAKTISHNFAVVKKDENWGVLTLDNNIFIPFEYRAIYIQEDSFHCYFSETEYKIINFDGQIIGEDEDNPEDYYDEPYDPDPWGAKAELDYIRNNGGDWIDD